MLVMNADCSSSGSRSTLSENSWLMVTEGRKRDSPLAPRSVQVASPARSATAAIQVAGRPQIVRGGQA